MDADILDARTVAWLLEDDPHRPGHLVHGEDDSVEHKESFSLARDALETLIRDVAAFANNRGGHILYGIEDGTRRVVGLKNQKFPDLDPQVLTRHFKEYLSETPRWEKRLLQCDGRPIGILGVAKSPKKPIFITKQGAELREGEIPFRYAGQTSVTRAGELRTILEDRIAAERHAWQEWLLQVAKLDPSSVAIIDPSTRLAHIGERTAVVDEALLEQIALVRSSEGDTEAGAPVLQIAGSIKAFQTIPGASPITISVPRAVMQDDIIDAFLAGECQYPRAFLRALPERPSCYLPLWFFVNKARITAREAEELLREGAIGQRRIRERLIERLRTDDLPRYRNGKIDGRSPPFEVSSATFADVIRREVKERGLKQRPLRALKRHLALYLLRKGAMSPEDDILSSEVEILLEALTHLEAAEIVHKVTLARELLRRAWQRPDVLRDQTLLRKATCYVDIALYRGSV